MERLQKVIAASGLTSRRKAEELITAGKVKVNGVVVDKLGTQVDKNDVITVEDKPLPHEELEYYLVNKPRKYICSVNDEHGRKQVTDLVETEARIYPVGRLDYDSSGLIILTNDGNFANMLMHPKYHLPKTYHVTVKGLVSKADVYRLREGVKLDDGIKTYFFKKLVKVLNKSVNEYLMKFELKNTTIEFDETMTETMVTNMVPRTYSSYSSGERTRIDMSILLAFFDISRQISNWSCNILFIDELLDQNIDQSGIEQFVSTLYNLIQVNKKKLGIYIISHKLNELKIQISSTIEIRKVHDYSILEVKYG